MESEGGTGKDLKKRCVLSLEWKRGVIVGESGDEDIVEPTCVGW